MSEINNKQKVGTVYLITEEGGGSYLDADFSWYVELTQEEKVKLGDALLKVQEVLFGSLDRIEEKNDEKEGE